MNRIGKRFISILVPPFANLSNPTGFRLVQWAIAALNWRRVVPDFCAVGISHYQQCVAHSQALISGIGYRQFDVATNADRLIGECLLRNK